MRKKFDSNIILAVVFILVLLLIFVLGGFIFCKSSLSSILQLNRSLSYEVTYGDDGRAYLDEEILGLCQKFMKENNPTQEIIRTSHHNNQQNVTWYWSILGNKKLILESKTRNAYIETDGQVYNIGYIDFDKQILEEYTSSEEYYICNESIYTVSEHSVLKWHLGTCKTIPINVGQCKIVNSIENVDSQEKDLLLYNGENYYILTSSKLEQVSTKATPQFVISGKALIWISYDMKLMVTNLLTKESYIKEDNVYNVEKIEETICYYTDNGKKEWNYFIDLDGTIYEI